MMILQTRIKIEKVNNNINVVNQNVKKHIIHIQHFTIIVKKHIMDNSLLDHLLTINFLMDLRRIEGDLGLKKIK